MGLKVLVTGCTGLVGHGICLHLLRQGHLVWGTSRGTIASRHERFTPVELDVTSDESVAAAADLIDEMDAVVHNSALIPAMATDMANSREAFFEVNTLGTYRILEVAREVASFLYISTTALVQGENSAITEEHPLFPCSAYAVSKIAGELACKQFGLRENMTVATLRIRAPFGYSGTAPAVIPRFVAAAKAGEDLALWGRGRREQVFTFVEDVGLACELAIRAEANGVFNVAGAESTSMKKLAETVLRTYPESDSQIVLSDRADPLENQRAAVSIEKARRELGFTPAHTLEAGLAKIRDADERTDVRFFEPLGRETVRAGV